MSSLTSQIASRIANARTPQSARNLTNDFSCSDTFARKTLASLVANGQVVRISEPGQPTRFASATKRSTPAASRIIAALRGARRPLNANQVSSRARCSYTYARKALTKLVANGSVNEESFFNHMSDAEVAVYSV